VKEKEAVSGWPLQRIHALRAIRTVHVQQRLAVSPDRALRTAPHVGFICAGRKLFALARYAARERLV
jgi:hypothetical protein